MPAAPERVVLKRKARDEAVDTLRLEQTTENDPRPDRSRKRRVTDIYFQRVPSHAKPQETTPALPIKSQTLDRRASFDPQAIPKIRATTEADEVNDFLKYKTAGSLRQADAQDASDSQTRISEQPTNTTEPDKIPTSVKPATSKPLRRFHLTRDLSSHSRVDAHGKISKPASRIRPPLPTFIERVQRAITNGLDPMYIQQPIDRILNTSGEDSKPDRAENSVKSSAPSASSQTVPTFIKPLPTTNKVGRSIADHPSTWDINSDQLANELAALAIEMDEDSTSQVPPPSNGPAISSAKPSKPNLPASEDEYVYDTYIRMDPTGDTDEDVPYLDDPKVGILIIDEEDQEFWEEYLMSDDDEEWDEEDSNAEDNPANDYPEEDLDSDDEPYLHRRNDSDDEQFDEDDFRD